MDVARLSPIRQSQLRRRGVRLEIVTLGWNVIGVIVLMVLAAAASSVALVGFALDSVIEIGASIVVIWELRGVGEHRQRRALRLIGVGFVALAIYLVVQSTCALVAGQHAAPSVNGIIWTALTAIVMFFLAAAKLTTGRTLGNLTLITEGRVTLIDAFLAVSVLLGLTLNLAFGWWWADPVAALVIVYYALREARSIFWPTAP